MLGNKESVNVSLNEKELVQYSAILCPLNNLKNEEFTAKLSAKPI